ncbi:MAG TPA: DUF2442 domain-containing protein [Thermomicrobiales bacterium]|jgi:hypothetical protein
MEHRERAVEVKVLRPYVIEVTFNNGVRKEVDLEPELWGTAFEPLRDTELFAQAEVDPSAGSVYWPTGADLAPEFLYYGEDTPYGRVEFGPREAQLLTRTGTQ